MTITLPHNIFASLLAQALPEKLRTMIDYKPAAVIAGMLSEGKTDIALIPSLDLIKHKDLIASSRRGISFDGILSNSYLYFQPDQQHIGEFGMTGDTTSTDVILLRILMRESYGEDVAIKLLQSLKEGHTGNLMISGDQNYYSNKFAGGINFAEEIIDLINLPFVNFVFCAREREKVEWLENETPGIESHVYELAETADWDFRLDETAKDLFRDNISHVLYEFEEQDKEGLIQLLRLPYFHSVIDDIVDIQFT